MKSHSRRNKIVLIAVLCVAIIFIILRYSNTTSTMRVRPRTGPIVEAVYAVGTVKSDRTYNLKTGIPATVTRIYVTEGQDVKKNSPLVSTDAGITFHAPFAGTVTRLYCEEGELAITGTVLLTLMDLSSTYVQLSIDQQSALRVRKGQIAELTVETIRGKVFNGVVESIYPSDGQFLARIRVTLPQEVLPEMTTDVAIQVARKESALLIPLTSIREGAVTVYRGGKKITVRANIGAIDGAWGEVLDDSIAPTDEIVIMKKQ